MKDKTMACKPKSQLRAADGMELTHRFGKQTLRMADGGDTMPQNRVPMSEQDQGAFNSLQNTPTGSIVEPAAAPAAKTDVRERMLAAGQRTQTFQPMMNNIAQQPVLAPRPMMLRDGGEVSPWSLKGMAGAVSNAFADTPEQARQKALVAQYKAEKAAAPAPAPVASAPAPTAGIQGYVANGALARREAAAGLRDGGTVPGKGSGDKIPALYEPGEFVVSNDMLDAAPGLREGLHDLRGNVLAAKGKTVEEADAQAVGGKTLRAADGAATDWMSRSLQGQRMFPAPSPMQSMADTLRASPTVADVAPPQYTKPPVDTATGRYINEGIPRSSPGTQVGSAGQQAGRAGASVGMGTPTAGVQAGGAGVGGGSSSGVSGAVRQGLGGVRTGLSTQPGLISKAAYLGGRVLSNPLVAGAGKVAGAAGVVQNFNDYKIDDPDVDSSNAGTMRALREGDFSKAGRSFSKGALEAGMDLGSFAANTLDYVVPGKAPVSTAYNKALRNAFGDQLIDRSGNAAPNSAPAAAPSTTQPAVVPQRTQLRASQDPRVVNADISRPELGASRDFSNELNGAKGALPADLREGVVHKTVDAQGRVTYSGRNVAPGADGSTQFVDGMGRTLRSSGNVSTVPAMDPGLVASTLHNPDGSKWSAADNAIMAANLRDGVNPYRGTSRAAAEDAEAIPAIGEFGHNRAVAAKLAKDQLKATLRGQDLDYGSKLAQNKISMFNALREQGNKDRDFNAGRSDKNIELAGKFDEQARGAFKNKFDSVDKDGKLISRPDLEAAAYGEAVRQSNGRWSQLTPAERAEYMADAFDHVKLLSSARNHQNNSIWQAVGLANKDAAHGGMPSKAEMQGAKLTELGLIDGASTMNAGRGDYKLTLKNGQVMHFGRGDLSQAQLKRLQDLGATLGDK